MGRRTTLIFDLFFSSFLDGWLDLNACAVLHQGWSRGCNNDQNGPHRARGRADRGRPHGRHGPDRGGCARELRGLRAPRRARPQTTARRHPAREAALARGAPRLHGGKPHRVHGDGDAGPGQPAGPHDGQRVFEDRAPGDPDEVVHPGVQGTGVAARGKVDGGLPPAVKRRLRGIARSLEAMISGDIERQIPISEAQDELDAVCYSMNILVGELAFTTANLRRAQAEAEAANAAKSTFLRTASHELRTPLAVIVWLSELLKDPSRVPPERFARSLAGIRRSAEELLRTAEAVLDLSRLDDPTVKPEAEPIDLAGTVREAVENLQPLAERKQIGLRMTIQPGAPATVMTNGQHARQVVMNLVANAIKFTLQGEVVVRVHRLGSQAAVDVADTGFGIPEASRARIFEPFFQVNRSSAQKIGGSGGGLALGSA